MSDADKTTKKTPLKPDAELLCRLGAVAVHAKELLAGPSPFAKMQLKTIFRDPDVAEWLAEMDSRGLLPVARVKLMLEEK